MNARAWSCLMLPPLGWLGALLEGRELTLEVVAILKLVGTVEMLQRPLVGCSEVVCMMLGQLQVQQ